MNNNLNNKNNKVIINKNKSISKSSNINSKCIGPCYPENTLFYHPLTLIPYKNNEDTCPIKPYKDTMYKKCYINNKNIDYTNYDIFGDVVQIAKSFNIFLKQFYNISNISDIDVFIENNINDLPLLSQKRILDALYKTYKDDNNFPSEVYLNKIKDILKELYNIDIKTKKILEKIVKNKYKDNWKNIFDYFISKYNNKSK